MDDMLEYCYKLFLASSNKRDAMDLMGYSFKSLKRKGDMMAESLDASNKRFELAMKELGRKASKWIRKHK